MSFPFIWLKALQIMNNPTSWWFQLIWKILVKMDHFPKWEWKWQIFETTNQSQIPQPITSFISSHPLAPLRRLQRRCCRCWWCRCHRWCPWWRMIHSWGRGSCWLLFVRLEPKMTLVLIGPETFFPGWNKENEDSHSSMIFLSIADVECLKPSEWKWIHECISKCRCNMFVKEEQGPMASIFHRYGFFSRKYPGTRKLPTQPTVWSDFTWIH